MSPFIRTAGLVFIAGVVIVKLASDNRDKIASSFNSFTEKWRNASKASKAEIVSAKPLRTVDVA